MAGSVGGGGGRRGCAHRWTDSLTPGFARLSRWDKWGAANDRFLVVKANCPLLAAEGRPRIPGRFIPNSAFLTAITPAMTHLALLEVESPPKARWKVAGPMIPNR